MNYTRSSYVKSTLLASLALAFTLSSCSAPVVDEPKPSSTPTVSTTGQPNPAPTGTPTLTATPSAPIKSQTPEAVAPKLKTFTFSDGHISFDYPANWTVETHQGGYFDPAKKANAVKAVISDEKGDVVAHISSGTEGGATGGPVIRTILDSKELPAFKTTEGPASFAFLKDDYPSGGEPYYFMGVVTERYMEEGETASVNSFLLVENGLASAVVEFGSPAFKSLDSAKAWMKTEQYNKLKTMMTSLKYS
jgi:hypothetical protein